LFGQAPYAEVVLDDLETQAGLLPEPMQKLGALLIVSHIRKQLRRGKAGSATLEPART
jgi:hypothetical protein